MAFDFERLDVYQKAKNINSAVYRLLKSRPALGRTIRDQLGRASLSTMLNIAEGAGRFGKKDKRHFYIISRSSVFECVALLDFLNEEGLVENEEYEWYYEKYEELSKILYRMIGNLSQ